MRNAVYQTCPSQFCNNFAGNEEVQMHNFDVSSNVLDNSLLHYFQVFDDLCLGNFSSNPEFSQAFNTLQIPSGLPNTTSLASLQRFESVPSVPETKHEIKNARKCSEPVDKDITKGKKMKAVCAEDRPPCMVVEEPSSDNQEKEKKAPVRRSQKIGDKITALQKLVSPFGKTDTASVLQEAASHIKYLQQQIEVLSSPYFSVYGSLCSQVNGGSVGNLRSRGLCLVPVSYTRNLDQVDRGERFIGRATIPGNY